MKKIKLIAMGGTISAHHTKRTDLRNYTSGHYTGEDLIREIPEMNEIAELHIEQLSNVSSTLIDTEHWLMLRDKIHHDLSDGNYDGIVITHGTNTLEETAYFLHLTVESDKPIVLTGAQRPFSAISSDAHLNLLNALKVAASDSSVGKGVLVVLNDQISCARDVSKTNTYRLETFNSGELGVLGYVDPDDSVQFYRMSVRKHTTSSEFAILPISDLPKVEIIYSYAGATGRTIRPLLDEERVDGIIVAGTGAGRCSEKEEVELIEAKKKGIQIVLGSRVMNGRVLPLERYKHLQASTSDNLPPHKARILLMLGLLKYRDNESIQTLFDMY
ncbi:L-asparaginase 2 [Sporosarcina luteola]|uniref:L-asparaginase 2 n=1 Tax=Sporosarcina luteola TaxID=582850 RepID=A0A511Z4R8_9BACL|nr:asparaginase [Sporosarcina luteola]GEN82448.1 L-asparaginase 2 [Sporosarcina luteola]